MAKVLVVDDEYSVRLLLSTWLHRAGHETVQAGSAEEALVQMEATSADVVFCDLVMPGRGGLWLVEQLRARFPNAALVLATGISDVPPRQSMQNGVLDYLVKPFDHDAVMEAVDMAAMWHAQAVAAPVPAPKPQKPFEEWADGLD